MRDKNDEINPTKQVSAQDQTYKSLDVKLDPIKTNNMFTKMNIPFNKNIYPSRPNELKNKYDDLN